MKVLLVLLSLIAVPLISIVTMIHGWGVEPKSWPIIALGYVATMLVTVAMTASS